MNISIRSRRKALGGPRHRERGSPLHRPRRAGRSRRADGVDGHAAAAHKCLVATGSGDPAFVRNFNPYVQGIPSSSFVRGGMYEPLVITTPAGGGKEYKWLARAMPGARTPRAHAEPAQGRQVVGRQAADRRRRRLQPHGRQAGQDDGHDRRLPRGDEHRLDQAEGRQPGRHRAEDQGLAVRGRQPERRLHRAQARVLEGRGHQQVPQPEPGRLRAVHPGGEVQQRSPTC